MVPARSLGRDVVALLDEDPDLAPGLEPEQFEAARRRAIAAVIETDPPGWDTSDIESAAEDGWLGLFLVDGLLLRRVQVGRRPACELFGPGDLIRPWDADGEYAPLPITVDWLVLRPTRMAVLDTAFVLRVARWPVIASRIVGRVAQRARSLALTQAVTHLPRAYARLLILFWLLAERWGRVSPSGVYVTLPVTHEVLAMLVGAQRPTVTIALQRLTRAGFLIRERSDHWLLTNEAIRCLEQPESLELVDGSDTL
ncbi:MAG: Crp/Fnr family transcriptional regulator [Solirubrobacterales bacterium]|nr:Crp/Fnr family transcriptional regulator [Solirubrobacterales bacterium]